MGTPENQAIYGFSVQGSSYNIIPMNGDDYVNIIREEHMRTHRGQAFICSDVVSLTNAQSTGFLMFVASGNPCHLRHWEITADGSPVTFTFFEVSSNNTITTTGALAPCANANRPSLNQSSVTLYTGSIVTSKGLQLEHARTTGNKQAGGSKGNLTTEWVLNSDRWYYFDLVNESGGATIADYYFFWYEPRDD